VSARNRATAAEIRRAKTQVLDDPPPGEPPGHPEPVHVLLATPASEIKVKATEWLWQQRIPLGALTLLPGREGTGKSTFGAWLAARVTKGELAGIYEGIPKGVFYVATEDDWSRTIAPRLIAAGADMDRVFKIAIGVEGSDLLAELSLPQHVGQLRDGIRKHDVGLAFFDPLMSAISSALDTHKDRETRMALEPMAAIAMDTDSAVVGLSHFSKAMTTDALNLVMASKAFTAVPRAVIGMARDDQADEENTVVLSQIKSNLGPLDVPSLKFTFMPVAVETEDGRAAHVGKLVMLGVTDRSVNDILAGRGDEADQDTWNAACWWLYDHLQKSGGEGAASDILATGKSAGHSKDSLKRASLTLALDKRKNGFQGPSMWIYNPEASKQPGAPRPAAGPATAPARAKPQAQGNAGKGARRPTGNGGKVVPIRPEVDGGDPA
jgi:AAA domain